MAGIFFLLYNREQMKKKILFTKFRWQVVELRVKHMYFNFFFTVVSMVPHKNHLPPSFLEFFICLR